jgi:hypothetical protein
LLANASPAHAYIGPGAGFALLSSFFVFFTTLVGGELPIVPKTRLNGTRHCGDPARPKSVPR